MTQTRLLLLVLGLAVTACGSGGSDSSDTSVDTSDTTGDTTSDSSDGLTLVSSAMTDGGSLPTTYTCDGSSISPPVSWSSAPDATQSYALVMDHIVSDSDIHSYWVMYDIPSSVSALTAGETQGTLGSNSVNDLPAYSPPCSQGSGEKWYNIRLYALSQAPDMSGYSQANRANLLEAIADITLESVTMTVSYDRDTASDSSRCEQIQSSVSAAGFTEVSVSCDSNYAYITSDTYPDHDLMNGISGTNEQIPVPALDYAAPIVLNPVLASSPTSIDAALGVAVNGVPIYDYSAQGELDLYNYDAGTDTLALGQLDNCGGHAGRGDDYHYHAKPECMIAAMDNAGDDAILGWGYDGYPLYGDNNPDGSSIEEGELDVCNGQSDDTYGYRYHTSTQAPYIVQCLMGEVDTSILPRVSPLSGDTQGIRADLTPPQGGVTNLVFSESDDGTRRMSYDYAGQSYYTEYAPAASDNCYDFEQKTISGGGVVQTGTFCR